MELEYLQNFEDQDCLASGHVHIVGYCNCTIFEFYIGPRTSHDSLLSGFATV